MLKMIYPIFWMGFLFLAKDIHAQIYQLFEPLVITSNEGDTLRYRLARPQVEIPFGERVPVVVLLHGAGERGNDNRRQLVHVAEDFIRREVRYKYPCFIVAPQCPEGAWWSSGNYDYQSREQRYDSSTTVQQELIMEVVERLIAEENGDPSRVYITGLSMGGAGTWDMLAHYPNRFAAAIPICGPTSKQFAEYIPDLPIWVFHGADDSVVSVTDSRSIVAALRQQGKEVIYTEFEGVDHNSWDYVYADQLFVLDWLFAQRRR